MNQMTKKRNCIYILSLHPIFHTEESPVFDKLSQQDSIILHSALIANFLDIFTLNDLSAKIIFCLDEKDRSYYPKNFFPAEIKILFINSNEDKSNLDKLQQSYFSTFENNLLIRADTIGISLKHFNKIFDMLSIEDDVLVIGKSERNRVAFIGFNTAENKLLEKMFSVKFNYYKFLSEAGKSELFLNTLQGFQVVEDFGDFKNLYIELSKKESLSYCSKQMHERFTNLFIEYKDLLNE